MSIQLKSTLDIQRTDAKNQKVSVDYQFDKNALKKADGDKFIVLFGLRNAADDSFITHLGDDEIALSTPSGADLRWTFSTNVPDEVLDVNKGVSRANKDIKSDSVYVRVRVFNIDNEPAANIKTNEVSGTFGPVGMNI